MAKRVAGGLHGASNRVGAGSAAGSLRRKGSNALRTMGNYPRRTAGGAAALGAVGMSNRRGSQDYPMY